MQDRNRDTKIDAFINQCKAHKLKITPQRIAIFRELVQSKKHPSADTMFHSIRKAFPNISFDTVNRTLLTLARIGIIDVVEGQGGPRRFDPDIRQHHHFYCMECGKILDLFSDRLDRVDIPSQLPEGYSVFSKRMVLKGCCPECKKGL